MLASLIQYFTACIVMHIYNHLCGTAHKYICIYVCNMLARSGATLETIFPLFSNVKTFRWFLPASVVGFLFKTYHIFAFENILICFWLVSVIPLKYFQATCCACNCCNISRERKMLKCWLRLLSTHKYMYVCLYVLNYLWCLIYTVF